MSLSSTLNGLIPRFLRPVDLASKYYLNASGSVIRGGPFQGMRYIDRAHCSQLLPKIAGSYETELTECFAKIVAAKPDVFVDIGAAEGYYAVGAAFRGWSKKIVAFESEDDARSAIAEMMKLNAIPASAIELRGLCRPDELNDLLGHYAHPAVLIDVEGFEAFLLDPLRVPNLARCRILLEYHDFVLPGLQSELTRRMSATHQITSIDQQARRADQLPSGATLVSLLPSAIRRRMLNEQRPFSRHGWLYFEPIGRS